MVRLALPDRLERLASTDPPAQRVLRQTSLALLVLLVRPARLVLQAAPLVRLGLLARLALAVLPVLRVQPDPQAQQV